MLAHLDAFLADPVDRRLDADLARPVHFAQEIQLQPGNHHPMPEPGSSSPAACINSDRPASHITL